MKVVIIGGVAAGPKTAARLRRLNPDAEITIIEKGRFLSYAGCGMPYFVSGDVPEWKKLTDTPTGVVRDAFFFQQVKGIRVLDRTLAERIDRKRKTVIAVQLETGEQQILPYDKLVLATGGLPVQLPVEGTDLNHVFRLWQAEDALSMNKALSMGTLKRAVIIGGGLIGVEMTEALVKRGLRVTLVEMLPHLLPGLLDPETAVFLTRHLRSRGVEVYCGEKVSCLKGNDRGCLEKVITAQREIPADIALVSIGVRPNSKLAADAGLQVGKSGEIRVDEFLRTSDPDIYAGGDCVQNIHLLTGKPVYAPMGSTANKHGRVIANNIMGLPEKFKGILATAVLKAFDYNVGKTGLTETQAREAGFHPVTCLTPSADIPHFYPRANQVFLKLIADQKTRKILGAQVAGPGEGVKRIDVVATALAFGATVDDLPAVDLGYAPPYATAIDLAAHAANILRNKMEGVARALPPSAVKTLVDRGEDFVWLDVRSPEEFARKRIDDPRVKLIPLGTLRRRLEDLPRNKKIISLCKISLRAYEAQTILQGAGFNDVYFMDGGIEAWPYEVKTEIQNGKEDL